MLKITEPKKVLCIHDLSGVGRCSLAVILPVLSVMGVQPVALPTVVLSTHTGGFGTPARLDGCAYGEAALEHYRELGLSFDCIYTGYLGGEEQAALAEKAFDLWPAARKIVDPVMGDDGRTYGIYSAALLDGMKALSRKADVITPNLTEACLLADYDIEKVYSDTRKDVLLPLATEISEKLRDLSGKNQDVIITGIKCRDDKSPFIYNLVTTANGTTTHRSHFFDVSFSGTGDLFASVICGSRLNGFSTEEAAERAGKFLYDSIADTMNDDTAPNDGVNFEKFLRELM